MVSENQAESSYDPGTLNHASTYYWKVVSEDNHGNVTESPVWSFTTSVAYTITPVPTLGGDESRLWKISNTGYAAGAAQQADGTWHAIRWDAVDGSVDLGSPEGDKSYAYNVNDAGTCVVVSYDGVSGYRKDYFTYVGDPGGLVPIGSYGGGTYSHSINKYGEVVGYSYDANGENGKSIRWDSDHGLRDITGIGGPGTVFGASDINDHGWIVGASDDWSDDGYTHGVIWDEINGARDAGGLGMWGNLYFLNNNGVAVGRHYDEEKWMWAVRWDEENGLVNLSSFGEDWESQAVGINAHEDIVGSCWDERDDVDHSSSRSALWKDGHIANQNDLISPDNGWVLQMSEGINDSGQIAGYGWLDGVKTGYVLTEVNAAPFAPANPFPADGAAGVSSEALSWTCRDPNTGDGLTFDVYFGTSPDPDLVVQNLANASYSPAWLQSGETYYFKVAAKDEMGLSTEGPVWSFTMGEVHHEHELIACYPFEGNAQDISGNDYHGNVFGALLCADRFGNPDSAYSFDGEDDWIDIPFDFPMHSDGDYSISFWLRRDDDAHRTVFWSKNNADDANRFHFYSGALVGRGGSGFGFDYRTPEGELHSLPGSQILPNSWVLIHITRTGGTYRQFVNGLIDRIVEDNEPDLPNATGHWRIGWRPGYMFKGAIDDIRFYQGALSEEEVSEDFNNSAPEYVPQTPSFPYPPDLSGEIANRTLLSWTGGDLDPRDLVTYDIYFGSVDSLTLVDSDYTLTSYFPGILDPSTTYQWKIVARDSVGNQTEGPIWQFSTNGFEASATEIGGWLESNMVLPFNGSPYLLVDLTVPQDITLAIEPGVVVKFPDGQGMEIQGTILAEGAADGPIYFTSIMDDSIGGDTNGDGDATLPVRGSWSSLHFDAAGQGSVLEHVVIRYGGGWGPPGMLDINSPSVTMNSCVIEESGANGVWIVDGGATITESVIRNNDWDGINITNATFMTVTNNYISGNLGQGMHLEGLPRNYALAGNSMDGNGSNGIGIVGNISGDASLTNLEAPYVCRGFVIDPGVTLTIDPGVVVKALEGQGVDIQGTLVAEGTPYSPICFTSILDDSVGGDTNNDGEATLPVRGSWSSLHFDAAGQGSVLEHVIIRYGGGWGPPGMLDINSPSITITSCVIEESATNGVYVDSGGAAITGSVIRNNEWDGIYIANASFMTVLNNHISGNLGQGMHLEGLPGNYALAGNSMDGNGSNGIGIVGNISGDASLTNLEAPYVCRGFVIDPGVTLTIDPGVVVKALEGQGVDIQGTLVAEGTPYSPICFTSILDDSVGGDTNNDGDTTLPVRGSWSSLHFDSAGQGSVLEHVIIRYGGGWGPPGMVDINSPLVTLSNCVIEEGFSNGVWVDSGGAAITGSVIRNNEWDGIYITNASFMTVMNNHISGNLGQGMHLEGLPANYVLSGNGMDSNGSNGIGIIGNISVDTSLTNLEAPYVCRGFVIDPGVTLTIDPGVVVKALEGQGVEIQGTLVAEGTPYSPICFTSILDDSVGGDTNNDGEATLPVRGSWSSLHFDAAGQGSVLEHVIIRYGGCCGPPGMVDINSPSVTLSNCVIEESFSNGVWVDGGATITESVIGNNDWDGINITNASFMTVTNNHISGNLGLGMHLEGLPTNYVLLGNGMDGNGLNGIGIVGNISGDASLTNLEAPYICQGFVIDPGVTLTIDPGVVVKALEGQGVDIQGTLVAEGTPYSPIFFTSILDDSVGGDTNNDGDATLPVRGSWSSLHFDAAGQGSVLEHVVIRYGGGWGPPGMLDINSPSVTMNSCVIEESGANGVWIVDGGATITESVIRNNDWDGINITNATFITVTNNYISGNLGLGMHLEGLPTNYVLSGNGMDGNGSNGIGIIGNISGDASLTNLEAPYVCRGFVIDPGVTLTIDPGVVVKALEGQGVDIQGTLVAEGTPYSPICFTSILDDSVGGDTNNDGEATLPVRGSWSSLHFDAAGQGSVLEHVIIRYGGGWGPPGMLDINSPLVTLSNCMIEESATNGVWVDSGGAAITGSVISNNDGDGINITNASFMTVTNNDISGNAGLGIYHQSAGATIAAKQNYWGHASGPLDPSDDRETGGLFNPEGQGDRVSDYVDYEPWSPFPDKDADGISDDWELFHFGSLLVADGDSDYDGDGMPDAWEARFGLNPKINDANDDPDEDGYSNFTEWQNGTDPTDGNDPPAMGSVSGVLSDSEGLPLTGACIIFRDTPCGASWIGQGKADVTGAYRADLPPGTYYAWTNAQCSGEWNYIWNGGYDGSGGWVDHCEDTVPIVVLSGEVTSSVDMALEQRGVLSGTITAHDGRPMQNICVMAKTDPCAQEEAAVSTTDTDGHYALMLPEGTYYLQTEVDCHGSYTPTNQIDAWYAGEESATDCLEALGVAAVVGETTVVDFSLPWVGHILGVVKASDDVPLEGVRVLLSDAKDWDSFQKAGITGPDGAFSFEGLGAGLYYLYACTSCGGINYVGSWWHESYHVLDPEEAGSISLLPGQEPPEVVFSLQPGGSFRGRVVDVDGNGIEGVRPYAFTGPCGEGVVGWSMTDSEGYYRVYGMPQGQIHVYMDASFQGLNYVNVFWNGNPGWGTLDCHADTTVEVEVGGDTPDVNFILEEGNTISGTVFDTAGVPLEGVKIKAYGAKCDNLLGYRGRSQVRTDENGAYLLIGIPPGDHYLRAQKTGYADSWYNGNTGSFHCQTASSLVVSDGLDVLGIDFFLSTKGVIMGDVDNNQVVDLTDIGLALKAVSGIPPTVLISRESDANGDETIGLPDALYGLRKKCGLHLLVTGLTVTSGEGEAMLSWTNPMDVDFAGVRIVRKEGRAPANSDDGVVVYEGGKTVFTDAGLVGGITYHYAVYSYDWEGHIYQAVFTTAEQ